MDIMLERILSLVERDPKTGDFKHGAIKKFAVSLGYKSGNIVSMWINGDSKSYMKQLPLIATTYGVSIEWLRGETDKKEPATQTGDGLDDLQKQAFDLIKKMPTEQLQTVIGVLKAILGES